METVEAFLGTASEAQTINPQPMAQQFSSRTQPTGTQNDELITGTNAGERSDSALTPAGADRLPIEDTAEQKPDLAQLVSGNRMYEGPVTAPQMQLRYLATNAEQETAIPGTGILPDRNPTGSTAAPAAQILTKPLQSGEKTVPGQVAGTAASAASGISDPASGKAEMPAPGDIPVTVSRSNESDAVKAKSVFDQSVYEAQKKMRGDFKPKSPTEDNTEAPHQALQSLTAGTAEIRTGKSELLAAPESQESAETGDAEILGQVSAGIARGLEEGEKEFVVRLKPEGLGEITVLMAQKGGKVVLNIVASNAQTEKLISGEAAGLRESLRAYNAELQQVTSTETNPDAYSYLTGQDAQTGSGERFNQWQDAERQTGNGAYVFDGTADTAAEEPADRGIPLTNSLLNRYI
jgi:hypothetical protein